MSASGCVAYDSEKMLGSDITVALAAGNLGPVVHGLVHRISPWPWTATRAVMISDSQYLESDAAFISSAPIVIARLVKMVVDGRAEWYRVEPTPELHALSNFSIDPEDYRLMLERLGAKK